MEKDVLIFFRLRGFVFFESVYTDLFIVFGVFIVFLILIVFGVFD